jgi:hypothetical protein
MSKGITFHTISLNDLTSICASSAAENAIFTGKGELWIGLVAGKIILIFGSPILLVFESLGGVWFGWLASSFVIKTIGGAAALELEMRKCAISIADEKISAAFPHPSSRPLMPDGQERSAVLEKCRCSTSTQCSMSLVHADHDCVAAQAQHQPSALGDQMHDHALIVLQPKVPSADIAQGQAIADLSVRAREVAQLPEPVNLALSLNGRDADPSDAEAADSERVGVTPNTVNATVHAGPKC